MLHKPLLTFSLNYFLGFQKYTNFRIGLIRPIHLTSLAFSIASFSSFSFKEPSLKYTFLAFLYITVAGIAPLQLLSTLLIQLLGSVSLMCTISDSSSFLLTNGFKE